ncbi:MAG: ABC transporter substrate-binding protein [Acidobacteriota bacterium]
MHHFAEGDEPEKTVDYGLRHARRSLEAFSPEEVIRASRAALEFLDREWKGDRALEGEARLLLAQGRQMAGDISGALKDLESAIRIFEAQDQPERAVIVFLTGARAAWQARRTEETRRWVERGMEAARESQNAGNLRELLSLAATLANLRGEYSKANLYLEEAGRLEPAPAAAAEEEIPRGGRLVVPLANPVPATQPVDIQFVEEMELFTNIWETLLVTDDEGNLAPNLCEKWEAREDGRSFLLHLRTGVQFHDGHPLSAQAVKDAFQESIRGTTLDLPAGFGAIQGAAASSAGGSKDVDGLVVRGEHTLEIRLDEPLPVYMAFLTDPRTSVFRARREESDGHSHLPGTGPFCLASRQDDRLLLEKNPNYWKGTPPNLTGIEFRTGLSAAAIAAGFRSGEFDVGRDLRLDDLEEIVRHPHLRGRLVEVPRKFTYFVLFNILGGSVVKAPAVRRALAGVVRPHDLVWRTLGRFAQPAAGFLPPGIIGHDPGRRRESIPPEQAAHQLREENVPASFPLRAAVQPLLQDRYGPLLEALFSVWAELGARVSIATPDMDSFLKATENSGGIDMYVGRFGPDYDDPDNFTHTLFHSRSGFLRHYFSSTGADRTLEEGRSTRDPQIREALYRGFETSLLDDGILVPLFFDVDYRIASPRVRGIRLSNCPPFVNYAGLGKVETAPSKTEEHTEISGTLKVPMTARVTSLDPSLTQTVEQGEVLPCLYEGLTRAVGEAQIVPWLASHFEAQDNGGRFQFQLRPNVRFHDGRRFTARDVRYSFEHLLLNSGNPSRWLFSPIQGAKELLGGKTRDLSGIQIESANRLTIQLDTPLSFFPAVLSHPLAAIVPEGTERFGTSWQTGAVGTGPFRAVDFEPGRRLELERNPSYWREGYPASQRLLFDFGVSPAEILAQFRDGRYSLAADLKPGDVDTLRREAAFAAGHREAPRLLTYFAAFNIHQPPFDRRDQRQKLVRAVNVATIVRETLGKVALPAHGLIPPGLLGYEAARPSGPAPAERLAGKAPAARPRLSAAVHPIYTAEYSAFFQKLTETFHQAGVAVEQSTRTMDEFLEAEKKAEAHLFLARWLADYPDADTFALILHTQEGFLGRFCGSADLDRLIEAGRAESDPSARHSIYRRIEEQVARECLLLPLFHEQVYRFARPEVEGLSVSYQSPVVEYATLRITPQTDRGSP